MPSVATYVTDVCMRQWDHENRNGAWFPIATMGFTIKGTTNIYTMWVIFMYSK